MKSDLHETPHETLCAGLPYAGERLLALEELHVLRRRSRRMRLAAVLTLILSPGWVALLMASFLVLPREAETARELAWMALVLGGMVGIAGTLLVARDLSRRGSELNRVGKLGHVRCFEGPIGWYDPTDLTFYRLVKRGLLDPQHEGPVRLELLPHVDSIYSVNEVRPRKRVPVRLTTAAPAPPDAPAWDVPQSWLNDDATGSLERRRPSPAEMEEMSTYVRAARRHAVTVLAPLILIFPLVSVIDDFRLPKPLAYAGAGAVAALYLTAIGKRVIQRSRFTRRLREDAEFGWILITPTLADARSQPKDGKPGPRVEFLPATNLLWTIDGKPAAWRSASHHRRRK